MSKTTENPETVSEIDRQIAALKTRRAEAMAPLIKEVRSIIASEGALETFDRLSVIAESLPADSAERACLRTLMQTLGHCRNVFKAG